MDEFASVNETRLESISAEIEVALDGIRSKVEVTGDASFDLALARVANPVTGEEEELYLDKPTGFTSTRSELGMSTVGRSRARRSASTYPGNTRSTRSSHMQGPELGP